VAAYDAFARFYDAVQGDRAEHAAYLRTLLARHHPGARSVLELACGTGSILKQLQDDYEVAGVDRSPAMLARAAEKVPGTRLVEGDMTEVRLGERFDAVLCVYDSINHLLRFEDWEATFDTAREHLAGGGIFVFDVNTERRLAELVAQRPPLVQWFDGGNLLVLDVVDGGGGEVAWEIRVFEQVERDRYRLHADDIRETAFPAARIRTSLRERFRRVRTYDDERSRPSPRSLRLHFVCWA
jgi:SAM-dependent methyltransferase